MINSSVGRQNALADHKLLRYVTFVVLYFSQGIPEGLTIFAIPAWMAANGKSTAEIAGYSAAVIIPFSLKILFAPMIERYTFLPMGRRRPWLLLGQFGIMCALIGMSMVADPLNNISVLTMAAVLVHVFVLCQDIATDSLVIDIVPPEQQGTANSFMWGSKTVGTSLSLAVGSVLINAYGLKFTLLCAASAVFCIMFIPLFLRERSGEKLLPWTKGQVSPQSAQLTVDSWKRLFRSFMQVVLLRNSLLMLCSLFVVMAALHYLRTGLPVLTIKELGWSNVFYSKVYSTSSLVGGILGMLIGALVIQRAGILKLIQGSALLLATLVFTFIAARGYWSNDYLIIAFIALFCVLLTLINIGVLALAMRLCWKRISAIQFTFSMTVFNAGLACGAALLGMLRSFLDWTYILLAFVLMLLVAMVIIRFIRTRRHSDQVDTLENRYVEILQQEGKWMTQPDAV